ncbi:hypothetical protein CAEBREN_17980 [Caenorhabditis brenneri]|uniref:Uncharacterized protein n=1 Tax=Caenorhabditis brenneri TaxID=135651 RepID=G0NYS3_CAEBE|nr:hypothetical protein CAEBREN_17980 [Caenorhabditis brenneri]
MNPKIWILFFLLLSFSSQSPAQPDVIEKEGNRPTIQKWELNSTFPGRRFEFLQLKGSARIGIDMADIVDEVALHNNMLKIQMNSSQRTTFELLKCNRPLFGIDVEANEATVLYLNGPWINHLIVLSKQRCLREDHEFFLSVKTTSAVNPTVASFSITSSKNIRTTPPKDGSKRDIIEVDKSNSTYLASLKNVIAYTRSKAINGSMIIAFDGLEMEKISFSKCGLLPKVIGLERKKVLAVEEDLLNYLDRLTHVFCDYDRNEGRVELTLQSASNCSNPCMGTIRFEYHDFSTLKEKLPGTIFTVIFIFIVSFCACCCCGCCREYMAKKTEMKRREAAGLDNPLDSDIIRMIDEANERDEEFRVRAKACQMIDEERHTNLDEKLKVFADVFNNATATRESVRNATRVINAGPDSDNIYESIPDLSEINLKHCSTAGLDKEKEMESHNTTSTSGAAPHVSRPTILDSVKWTVGAESVQINGDEEFESIDD